METALKDRIYFCLSCARCYREKEAYGEQLKRTFFVDTLAWKRNVVVRGLKVFLQVDFHLHVLIFSFLFRYLLTAIRTLHHRPWTSLTFRRRWPPIPKVRDARHCHGT